MLAGYWVRYPCWPYAASREESVHVLCRELYEYPGVLRKARAALRRTSQRARVERQDMMEARLECKHEANKHVDTWLSVTVTLFAHQPGTLSV